MGLASSVALRQVAEEVKAIWLRGGVPTLHLETIFKKIKVIVQKMIDYRKNRDSKSGKHQKLRDELVALLSEVFDIKLSDDRISDYVKEHPDRPYGIAERELYEDQISKRFWVAIRGVDKDWQEKQETKEEKKRKRDECEKARLDKWEQKKVEERAIFEVFTLPEPVTSEVQDMETDKVILTRNAQRKFESTGEIHLPKSEMTVRHSYHNVKTDLFDYMIAFQAACTVTPQTAIMSAKLFAKHVMHTEWYDEVDAKKAKQKAKHNGTKIIIKLNPKICLLNHMVFTSKVG